MTPEQQFLERLPLIEKVIGYVVRRHRMPPADAEEFAAEVKLKLVSDDYAVLRGFRGESRLETYLVTVIQRIRVDLEIGKHGKWRPSAAARRLGPVAVRFERLTGPLGRTPAEAREILRLEQGREIDRDELDALIDPLPRRERRLSVELDEASLPASSEAPDRGLERGERADLAERTAALLNGALADLPSRERLILRMLFEHGATVSAVARALRLDQRRLYRKIQSLYKDVRERLARDGVDREQIVELLSESDIEFDLRPLIGDSEETPAVGPSNMESAPGRSPGDTRD